MKKEPGKPSKRASRARPLLLAAAGSATLMMAGCRAVGSGNLPVYIVDMAGDQAQADAAQPPTDGGVSDGDAGLDR
jgi:hypothetical protein